jgi:hypothetical protein
MITERITQLKYKGKQLNQHNKSQIKIHYLKRISKNFSYFKILFILNIVLAYLLTNNFHGLVKCIIPYTMTHNEKVKAMELYFTVITFSIQIVITYFNAHIYPKYVNRMISLSLDKLEQDKLVVSQVERLSLNTVAYVLCNILIYFSAVFIFKNYPFALYFSIIMFCIYFLIARIELSELEGIYIEAKVLIPFCLILEKRGWKNSDLYKNYLYPYAEKQYNLIERGSYLYAYIAANMLFELILNYAISTYHELSTKSDELFYQYMNEFANNTNYGKAELIEKDDSYLKEIIAKLEILIIHNRKRLKKYEIEKEKKIKIITKILTGYSALKIYYRNHAFENNIFENRYYSNLIRSYYQRKKGRIYITSEIDRNVFEEFVKLLDYYIYDPTLFDYIKTSGLIDHYYISLFYRIGVVSNNQKRKDINECFILGLRELNMNCWRINL